jgi:hypothetical protein
MLSELQEQSARLLEAIETGCLVVVDDKAFPVEFYLQALEIAEGGELEDIDHDEADPDEPREARERRIKERWSELSPGKWEELSERAPVPDPPLGRNRRGSDSVTSPRGPESQPLD